ncbi:MAG: condensation domain-containing protein, partial [Candidatus Limivicinus sp.]
DAYFIRDTLAKSLAPYMIPSFFVQLDSIPLTVSGKIDRNQLKPPEKETLQSDYAPPENETEALLCRVMAAVLNLDWVGRNDDFFVLGGDSLKIQLLLAMLDDDTLRAVEITEGRTPARIATMMDAPELDTHMDAACRVGTFPLTQYQQHYYRYWKFAGNVTLGNSPGICRFRKGIVSAEALSEAMAAVMRHHPAFWTLISRNEDGEVFQRFDPAIVQAPKITLCTEEELPQREAELIRPFHLEDQPLYRCEIFSTPEAEVLFLDVHHIISDAASQLILARDLKRVLRGDVLAEDYYCSWLAAVTAPYTKDDTVAIAPDASYDRYPAFDFAEPADCDANTITVRLKASLQACSEQAKREGAKLPDLLLAAALRATGRYNGSDRVSANWLYAGRDLSVKDNMYGLLLSAMPVPADLSTVPDRASLLAQINTVNQHNYFCDEQSPGFFGERPVLDDTLTINYIPWLDKKKDAESELVSLVNQNQANSEVFYVIAIEEGPEGSLRLLFK